MPSRGHYTDEEIEHLTCYPAEIARSTPVYSATVIRDLASEVKRLRAALPSNNDPLFNVILSWYDCAKIDAVFRLQYIVPSYRLAHLVEICEKGQAGDKPVVMKGVCKYTAMRWKRDFEKLNIHLELVPHKP
jgi:hypothetical protein